MVITQEVRDHFLELAAFLRTGVIPPSATVKVDIDLVPAFCMRFWKDVSTKSVEHGDGKWFQVGRLKHNCDTVCCIGGYYEAFWGVNLDNKCKVLEELFYPAYSEQVRHIWEGLPGGGWLSSPETAAIAIERAMQLGDGEYGDNE
jgi:hypothetical protein